VQVLTPPSPAGHPLPSSDKQQTQHMGHTASTAATPRHPKPKGGRQSYGRAGPTPQAYAYSWPCLDVAAFLEKK